MLGMLRLLFFFQAEDGIRDLVRSRGLGDVYKRQVLHLSLPALTLTHLRHVSFDASHLVPVLMPWLLFLSLIHI